MSREKRKLRKKFIVFCEGDTEYNYIDTMRLNQGVELALKPINMHGGGYSNFLEVIKKEDLRDVVVVVTRYFGGVKLGAGGLVRAYTKGAKIGIDAAKVIEKVMYKEVRIKIDYNQLGKVQNEIMNMNYFVKDTIYEDNVEIIVYSRLEEVKVLTDKMIDITSATAEIKLCEEFYLSEQNGNIIL